MQTGNVKSPHSSIFFSTRSLGPILKRHRFRKVAVFTVRMETRKRRFQKFTLWKAFSESYVSMRVSSDTCGRGRKANQQRKSCVFKQKRIRVDRA